jgi:hypothetical protein
MAVGNIDGLFVIEVSLNLGIKNIWENRSHRK